MPWTAQGFKNEVYVLQEAYSSFVYALNGEQVYALDGSFIQYGSLWAEQLDNNGAWISQTEN